MTLELAVGFAELLLGVALVQQSIDFLTGPFLPRLLVMLRLLLALLLIINFYPVWVESLLVLTSCYMVIKFRGPYNGGSDTMTLLVLLCVWLSHLVTTQFAQELVLGYLAIQLTLSYFQSGWVKIINSDWRKGLALQDVFSLTAYPVSKGVRNWAQYPRLLLLMSWLVIGFELLFPLALLNRWLLIGALVVAAIFHLANAFLFGLNRFFWVWPSAYPIILWFQGRVLG